MIRSLERVPEAMTAGGASAVRTEPLLHSHVVDRWPSLWLPT